MRDYYEILGVSRDSDDATLKSAFRKLAMEHHPDRNGGAEASEARGQPAGTKRRQGGQRQACLICLARLDEARAQCGERGRGFLRDLRAGLGEYDAVRMAQ